MLGMRSPSSLAVSSMKTCIFVGFSHGWAEGVGSEYGYKQD